MKTAQDWGFISKEQTAIKPKLQDNKIFHALTSAYENNQQHEIYNATENIIRREKELCEMALSDLKKLGGGKKEQDQTLKLVVEHYQSRLEVTKEKEEKINLLSEDSRKMMEEYKKRTQELAEVKRSMMESQGKLRELAKTTERLIKKEEELRFIESNLRSELENNKRNIINGLYEIVHDFSDHSPEPIIAPQPDNIEPPHQEEKFQEKIEPKVNQTPVAITAAKQLPVPNPTVSTISDSSLLNTSEKSAPRLFTEGLFRNESNPVSDNIWSKDELQRNPPTQVAGTFIPSSRVQPIASKDREQDLITKAARLRMFEPGKSMVSKSMVKTADGEVISEFFYSPLHPKEGRHYIFNSLYAVASLLNLKSTNSAAFPERIKTVLTDLMSRLNNGQNIHLESFLGEEVNNAVITKLLDASKEKQSELFDAWVLKVLNRIESVGPGRSGLIDYQFRQLPKSDFSLRPGLSA